MADPTLLSVAEELAGEVNSLSSIDEWLEARGIDPLEMRAFLAHFDPAGSGGFFVQVGYELCARKHGDLPPAGSV